MKYVANPANETPTNAPEPDLGAMRLETIGRP